MMFSKEYGVQGKALDFCLLLHMSESENHWSSFIDGNNNEAQRGDVT